jgi:type IV secretory pathway VirB3-like protein
LEMSFLNILTYPIVVSEIILSWVYLCNHNYFLLTIWTVLYFLLKAIVYKDIQTHT